MIWTYLEPYHWCQCQQNLGFPMKASKDMPQRTKRTAIPSSCSFKTLIFLFCVRSISITNQGQVSQVLENIHRRVARFVYHDYKQNSSVTNMLTSLSWYLLEIRWQDLVWWTGSSVADYLTQACTTTCSANSHKVRCIGAKTVPYKSAFFPQTVTGMRQSQPDD